MVGRGTRLKRICHTIHTTDAVVVATVTNYSCHCRLSHSQHQRTRGPPSKLQLKQFQVSAGPVLSVSVSAADIQMVFGSVDNDEGIR